MQSDNYIFITIAVLFFVALLLISKTLEKELESITKVMSESFIEKINTKKIISDSILLRTGAILYIAMAIWWYYCANITEKPNYAGSFLSLEVIVPILILITALIATKGFFGVNPIKSKHDQIHSKVISDFLSAIGLATMLLTFASSVIEANYAERKISDNPFFSAKVDISCTKTDQGINPKISNINLKNCIIIAPTLIHNQTPILPYLKVLFLYIAASLMNFSVMHKLFSVRYEYSANPNKPTT